MLRRLKRFFARLGLTTAAVVLIALVVMFMWLRFFGLPESMKVRLVQELESRGVIVQVQRLLLDPSGGVVAEGLVVYRGPERQQIWVKVQRARIGLAWMAWWQGKPFVDSTEVDGADVSLPVGPNTAVELTQVNAAVEIVPGALEIVSANARWLDFQVSGRGRIALDGFVSHVAATPEQVEARERLWRQIEEEARKVQSDDGVRMEAEFNTDTKDPLRGQVDFRVDALGARWAGARVEALQIRGKLKDQLVSLDECRLRLARGEFALEGEANLQTKEAQVEFTSDLDFTPLGPAFSAHIADILSQLNFTQLPYCGGKGTISWANGVAFNVQADINWAGFSYGGVEFDKLQIPLAFDGQRLLIPEAQVSNSSGLLTLDLLYDRSKPEIKAKLSSSMDPTGFTGLFGEKADLFLQSLKFEQGGPVLEAKIEGTGLSPALLTAAGKISAEKMSYKNVALDQISGDFTFHDGQLIVPDLLVKRPEGQAGGALTYDFPDRWVELKDFRTSVLVQQVAPILGPKFTDYVRPYTLDGPPNLIVNGRVDLQAQKPDLDTNLKVQIDFPGQLEYKILKIPFQITQTKGLLTMVNRRLEVTINQAGFYGGSFNGKIGLSLGKPQVPYETTFKVDGSDFQKLMSLIYGYDKATGTAHATVSLTGILGDMQSLAGNGQVTVEDGYLMSIPVMGDLAQLVSGVIPNFMFSKAKKAQSTFTIAKGFIETRDLDISSATFSVIGNGTYNFVVDQLDFDMRVNIRGVMGLLTFSLSKLFEYHGSGSMKSPHWAPKLFSDDNSDHPRVTPTPSP